MIFIITSHCSVSLPHFDDIASAFFAGIVSCSSQGRIEIEARKRTVTTRLQLSFTQVHILVGPGLVTGHRGPFSILFC